jgi:hypothetical protein
MTLAIKRYRLLSNYTGKRQLSAVFVRRTKTSCVAIQQQFPTIKTSDVPAISPLNARPGFIHTETGLNLKY